MRFLPSSSSSSTSAAAAAAAVFSRFSRLLSSSPSSMTIPVRHRHSYDGGSVVAIMGATGTGKTKLSIDVATRFGSEIINSDKIQVYRGLDITTNKIPIPDRRGVPHHLIGSHDPAAGELSASSFRSLAASAVASISSRGRVPVVAGGSNSFIHAMVSDRFDPTSDPFAGPDGGSRGRPCRLRYRCCFIWVDVERAALREYLDRRVDEMVGSGMVEELEGYFGNMEAGAEWERNAGLNKAIGVPEFEGYFRRRTSYEEAVAAIKENTRRLAEEQVRKIRRLGESGWSLLRVDATGVVRERLGGARREVEEEMWEGAVSGPAIGAVEKFLGQDEGRQLIALPPAAVSSASCRCGC